MDREAAEVSGSEKKKIRDAAETALMLEETDDGPGELLVQPGHTGHTTGTRNCLGSFSSVKTLLLQQEPCDILYVTTDCPCWSCDTSGEHCCC